MFKVTPEKLEARLFDLESEMARVIEQAESAIAHEDEAAQALADEITVRTARRRYYGDIIHRIRQRLAR